MIPALSGKRPWIGNGTLAQKPSPWSSCQLEIPFDTGVYWIESGFPT